jgi:hypothetical protein
VDNKPSILFQELIPYLGKEEIQALAMRADKLTGEGFFPSPDPYRRAFPWPQL